MLDKQHNSVVTLAILLALVGVSKPAKAFLLAQADVTPTNFTIPEKLSESAKLKILTSNSTSSIDQSLKENFSAKYPQADVTLETQNTEDALNAIAEGRADVAGIGRNLTAEEKQQGFISVPISREKIAIVVSPDNPYDGNLTISQFAQIFRGEITDWSEIGGEAGAISLVDYPDVNDTRQAFPNYPVFQEGEFATGSNAVKLDEDSTDVMISQLGANGISYAVANDVIDRDDVKIVTMHQTQPDDPRYPFSQPFNLVYQGTPNEVTEAFLGFATTEAGEEVVANRVGSVSTAAAGAIASKLGSKPADAPVGTVDLPETTVDGEGEVVQPDPNTTAEGEVDSDAVAEGEVEPDAIAEGDVDPDAVAEGDVDPDAVAEGDVDPDAIAEGDVDPDAAAEGNTNPELDGSGDPNAELDGSGDPDAELEGSGDPNAELDGSGDPNAELDGSGDPNAELDGSGDPNAEVDPEEAVTDSNAIDEGDIAPVVPNETEVDGTDGAVATTREGKWWWWLPLILGIPILGAIALSGLGKEKRSDREPAIGNVPNIDSPDGNGGVPVRPDGGNLSAVGSVENTSNIASGTVNKASGIGNAAIATGGAAMAGGAAASNLIGRKKTTRNDVDLENTDIDLDLSDAEIDTPAVEIPSTPVNEFTGTETRLQTTDQSTRIQDDLDIEEDIDRNSPRFNDGISNPAGGAVAGGAAAVGGAALASGFLNDREDDSAEIRDATLESPAFSSETPTILQDGSVSEQTTRLQTNEDLDLELDETTTEARETQVSPQEFNGDFVLDEEAVSGSSQNLDLEDTIETTNVETPELETGVDTNIESSVEEVSVEEVDTPELETFETNTDISTELYDSDSFSDNIVADVETTSENLDFNLEEITLDDTDNSSDINLDEITFDDVDNSVESNLEEITLDDTENSSDINLDEITFDEVDNSVESNLEEITLDDTENSSDINLDEITFDDVNVATDEGGIDIDSLGFTEPVSSSTSNLSNIDAAEISDRSSDRAELSDDMSDISAWLNNLETPDRNSEDISGWLDSLNTDANVSESISNENAAVESTESTESEDTEDTEDISFQFLEDLLERDSQKDNNN